MVKLKSHFYNWYSNHCSLSIKYDLNKFLTIPYSTPVNFLKWKIVMLNYILIKIYKWVCVCVCVCEHVCVYVCVCVCVCVVCERYVCEYPIFIFEFLIVCSYVYNCTWAIKKLELELSPPLTSYILQVFDRFYIQRYNHNDKVKSLPFNYSLFLDWILSMSNKNNHTFQ